MSTPTAETGSAVAAETGSAMSSAIETGTVEVTAETIATLVETGGYTHPLFQRTDAGRPLPGQGLFLMMGGLVEQSGALDHAIAMVEVRRVSFRKMVVAGTSVRVRLEPGESRTTSSGKTLQDWTWTAVDADEETLAVAEVLMLLETTEEKA
ncbi:hypothetical protein [Aeromicrobium sp. Leaf350]|uniref:hypothetical protein n=1 Tax=Aeromicrobium sp. Leaf350 TaxID=2876565 RepID=UPI001E2ED248|nr:hypothetical protein [Aeromicrobium sp. Leaf350]